MTILDIKTLRYLVYDEDAGQFPFMRTKLRKLGCIHIDVADTPDKAAHIFEIENIDLVIISLRQHTERSWDFVNWLRSPKMTPKAGLPILALLDEIDDQILLSLIRRGVNYVALKPVSSAALGERIKKTLSTKLEMFRTENYYGPDRRRLPDKEYAGHNRRDFNTESQTARQKLAG
jgi:two-component system chemotaxis response regulator CheY